MEMDLDFEGAAFALPFQGWSRKNKSTADRPSSVLRAAWLPEPNLVGLSEMWMVKNGCASISFAVFTILFGDAKTPGSETSLPSLYLGIAQMCIGQKRLDLRVRLPSVIRQRDYEPSFQQRAYQR